MTERHGRLTLVTADVGRTADGHKLALWRCDCGNDARASLSRVRNGYTQSCGCLAAEVGKTVNTKHGHRRSAAYSSWQAMRGRCLNPDSKDYPRYGGAGITVDPAFDDFATFLAEVGERPAGTTLDRIDNRKGYEPGNIRWATVREQQTNRSTSYLVRIDGQVFQSVEDAAREFGVSTMTICRWCDGYVDKRRAHQANGGQILPRPGCARELRYAA